MVRLLEVWNNWFAVLLVRGCSKVDRSLAVWIGLEARDRIVNDRERCKVLDFQNVNIVVRSKVHSVELTLRKTDEGVSPFT